MVSRKRPNSAEDKTTARVSISDVERPRASPKPKRIARPAPQTAPAREKTFRLPPLESSADILRIANAGVRQRLGEELNNMEAAMTTRLHDLAAQLDHTTREIARLRQETIAMRASPINGLVIEVRHKVDTFHGSA